MSAPMVSQARHNIRIRFRVLMDASKARISILYKLFTEQCYNLLRVKGGTCGIVIPSGIYSDLGTKQLRTDAL